MIPNWINIEDYEKKINNKKNNKYRSSGAIHIEESFEERNRIW